ncbi:glycoside hydrolase family 19 protein [Aliarcobacter skirrowii]|uniref:Chitinase n=1 Tax=Aliarcobacter skirrowii CCUG 10374 TaxID=1032239 RepID=A0AAD0SL40_9BACT|nr:hypothetical protein [Aliarcobacter skirrowii]AXX84638.1 putative chitinase [Aliarcobacter skirrowii CCUG 10374]KAB0619389.1 hypothetical protein F7P70_09960 [Aliarcobacter skirrowii CCUG 10374]RXI24671.1 hypothetical protein CP959_10055 [Aliarcobacter skirrowii CCUG 10374]SUV14807.1 Predicted chitinase [Aliarcobacter skirrowii]
MIKKNIYECVTLDVTAMFDDGQPLKGSIAFVTKEYDIKLPEDKNKKEYILFKKEFTVEVKDDIAEYKFVIKKIIDDNNIKQEDIAYVKGWIDVDGEGEYDIEYDLEVFLEIELITKDMLVAMGCTNIEKEEELLEALNKYCKQYEINTPIRIAHFLSQTAHESGGFKKFEEDDTYRESIAIQNSCYKKYRESPEGKDIVLEPMIKDGKQVDFKCKQPEYFNCKYYKEDLGNSPEDGHKYRGRGLIQITGRTNYQGFTDEYNKKNQNDKQNFMDNPDLVSTNIDYSVASACYWWNNLSARGGSVNKYADKGATKIDVYNVSWCVNARQKQKKPFMPEYSEEANGLEDRWNKFEKIAKYLGLIK